MYFIFLNISTYKYINSVNFSHVIKINSLPLIFESILLSNFLLFEMRGYQFKHFILSKLNLDIKLFSSLDK